MKQEKSLVLQKQVDQIKALPIKSDDDLKQASDNIKAVIDLRKRIEAEEKEYTSPARAIIAKAKSIYKPLTDRCKELEAQLKSESSTYMLKKQQERRKEEEKIAKQLAEGKIKKPETAIRKMENLPEANKTIQSDTGSLRMSMIKKLKITDESKLPREFLVPDTTRIKKALQAGIAVPGAELEEVPSIGSYGN